MKELINAMKRAAQLEGSGRAGTRTGTVTSYDPTYYAVMVELHPDGFLSGWLPVLSPWTGNGWGMFAPPAIGDLVEVHFVDDNPEAGFVCQRFFTLQNRPLPVISGEFWIVHKLGASIKLTNDGKVTVTDKAGSTVVLQGDGTGTMSFANGLTINANVVVTGNIVASGEISDHTSNSMAAMRTTYNNHTHPETAIPGPTGQPQPINVKEQ